MTRSSLSLTPEILDYIIAANPIEHPVLEKCRLETAQIPNSQMQISPEQGSFMSFLIRLIDARLAVEVGVFTGYSALATALALRANAGPGARLFALDVSHKYMDIAKNYWAEAGALDAIVPMVGAAKDSLGQLIESGYAGKIDFIFIDADKVGYLEYLPLGKRLLRPGGLMLFDNVLREGKVADEAVTDEATKAMRQLVPLCHEDPKFEASMVGVGDGLLMVRRKS